MITLSVAMDPNKGIGQGDRLPWHLKDELKIFRQNTLHKHIIMGRKTYEGLPGKLKDRFLVILSRDPDYVCADGEVIHDLPAFLQEHEDDPEEYVVCGGASVYEQAYACCKKAYVSFLKRTYECDAYFRGFDLKDWIVVREEDHDEFIYRELLRK